MGCVSHAIFLEIRGVCLCFSLTLLPLSQNYVIQYVIAHGSAIDRHYLVSGLQGRMMALARHKFASNVVEKALIHSDSEVRRNLIDELLPPTPYRSDPIQAMMRDQYASKLSLLNPE